jgi:hypothetical protein
VPGGVRLMKAVFVAYVAVISLGLVYFVVIGLLRR